MDSLHVSYRLRRTADEVEAAARAIAIEQTVEIPDGLISDELRDSVVGRVESIDSSDGVDGCFDVVIAYRVELACGQLSQLLNLIYGNVSILPGVRVVDLQLPPVLLSSFRGPACGIDGVRERLAVAGRPLLATALKPRGSTVTELAAVATEFVSGGGDIVKDDHNLVDAELDGFRERVLRCQEALQAANRETGGSAIYLPNISGPAERLDAMLDVLLDAGVAGALVAPMLLGLDATRALAARATAHSAGRFIVMAHPSFSGSYYHDPGHGIAHELLLGTLFRLAGADASVFPHFGGRFAFRREECIAIGERLREPLGELAPASPAPAGGMQLSNIPDMADAYGADAIFLVGGALLGHSGGLREGTRVFREAIENCFPGGAANDTLNVP